MHLFILGATGRTGRALVEQAAARGHRLTALVRTPDTLPAPTVDGDPPSRRWARPVRAAC
jgi:uncharacterized protein YbjT (DUF2867 family)